MCRKAMDRHIGLDSINHKGLTKIQKSLLRFNINSKIKKIKNRNISRLFIFSKENLIKFQKNINYLHPKKKKKLQEAINSYVNYNWDFKNIKKLFQEKVKIRGKFILRIISKLEINLIKIREYLDNHNIYCKIYKYYNGIGTIYYSLEIHRKEEVKKILNMNMLNKNISKLLKEELNERKPKKNTRKCIRTSEAR